MVYLFSCVITEYLCHKWSWICSVCRNHNPALSSFMTCYQRCDKSNSTDATSGAGIAYPSGAHGFIPGTLLLFVLLNHQFSAYFFVDHCFSLFYLFVIVLSFFPRFTDSDYSFGIFKLYLIEVDVHILGVYKIRVVKWQLWHNIYIYI